MVYKLLASIQGCFWGLWVLYVHFMGVLGSVSRMSPLFTFFLPPPLGGVYTPPYLPPYFYVPMVHICVILWGIVGVYGAVCNGILLMGFKTV